MTTYVYRDGKMIVKGAASNTPQLQIIPEIKPYKNMIDGKMVTSRSAHRNLLRDHGCIEVGNEKMEAPPPPVVDRDARRRTLYQQLDNVTDRQANTFLAELKAHSRGR